MIKHLYAALMAVDSLPTACEFWCTKLGYQLVVDAPLGSDSRWVEIGSAGSSSTLALVEKSYLAASQPARASRPPDLVFETDDAQAERQRLQELGIGVSDVESDDASAWFHFDDQDGNTFMVLNSLPRIGRLSHTREQRR